MTSIFRIIDGRMTLRCAVFIFIWSSLITIIFTKGYGDLVCPSLPTNVKPCVTDMFKIIGEEENLEVNCNKEPILENESSKALPSFRIARMLDTISLRDCVLRRQPYSTAIAKLNITSLNSLKLIFDQYSRVKLYPEHFKGLETLESLSILSLATSSRLPISLKCLEIFENLRQLELERAVIPKLPEKNNVVNLSLISLPADSYQHWGGCAELKYLYIRGWRVLSLPDGWLSDCYNLATLKLVDLLLESLPPRMLAGAHSLLTITIDSVPIQHLPIDWLNNSLHIKTITIKSTAIQQLPRDFFSKRTLLEKLHLSGKKLQLSSLEELKNLTLLDTLILDFNPIKDLCYNNTPRNDSPFLPSLRRFSVAGTSISRFCMDWFFMPSLKSINLGFAEFTELTYHDIQSIVAKGLEVNLNFNHISVITYNKSNYENVVASTTKRSTAKILMDSKLYCDCHLYWFARTIREMPNHVNISKLQCDQNTKQPKPLKDIALNSMVCKLNKDQCAPGCKCYKRGVDDTVIANCSNAVLTAISTIPRLSELYAANNKISTITVDNVPDSLEVFDIRYNQVSQMNEDVLNTLFSVNNRRIWLAGNALSCQCSNRKYLEAVRLNRAMRFAV